MECYVKFALITVFYLLNTRDSNVFLKSSLVTFLNEESKVDNQNL